MPTGLGVGFVGPRFKRGPVAIQAGSRGWRRPLLQAKAEKRARTGEPSPTRAESHSGATLGRQDPFFSCDRTTATGR